VPAIKVCRVWDFVDLQVSIKPFSLSWAGSWCQTRADHGSQFLEARDQAVPMLHGFGKAF